jgi:hypothetical protein
MVNFNVLVDMLLPVALRGGVMRGWLYALIFPVAQVYESFMTGRRQNLYRLGITPQVCYLEKLLNDRYDPEVRGIVIGDAPHLLRSYVFIDGEDKPMYILGEEEGEQVYAYTEDEYAFGSAQFIIGLPASIQVDQKEVHGLVDDYKLAGKKYGIQLI